MVKIQMHCIHKTNNDIAIATNLNNSRVGNRNRISRYLKKRNRNRHRYWENQKIPKTE